MSSRERETPFGSQEPIEKNSEERRYAGAHSTLHEFVAQYAPQIGEDGRMLPLEDEKIESLPQEAARAAKALIEVISIKGEEHSSEHVGSEYRYRQISGTDSESKGYKPHTIATASAAPDANEASISMYREKDYGGGYREEMLNVNFYAEPKFYEVDTWSGNEPRNMYEYNKRTYLEKRATHMQETIGSVLNIIPEPISEINVFTSENPHPPSE